MRYLFNAPIPGHLEGAELLMPMIVFLTFTDLSLEWFFFNVVYRRGADGQ